MSHSLYYRMFKREVGQANHFLITMMVGLDAVNHGAKKEEDLHACWNPKNVNSSVIRSKQYAIKASLAWTVDNIDMYLRLCNREPRLYGEEESIKIAQTKHSVYNKFKCVTDMHSEVDSCKAAFADLLEKQSYSSWSQE